MDILIISHFCEGFTEADNGRFRYLANILSSDHEVEVLTSQFSHLKKARHESTDISAPFDVTFLPESGYKKNVCLKRFWSHFVWGIRVKKYLQKRKKPDVVFCAIPSLSGPYFAARYCRKNGIRFVIDVQDVWPDAFKLVFHMPVLSDLAFYPFKLLADYTYSAADEVCAVSETYVDRALLVNKKQNKGHCVYLGTNLGTFDRNKQRCAGGIAPLIDRGKKKFWLAYCGMLGSSYDLTCAFDAMHIIAERGYEVPGFMIMGNGPRRAEFEAYAGKLGLDAVFTGSLPYGQMCALLSQCDIAMNPIEKGSAQSIINKHGDYCAAGLPVVSTQENQEYRKLVDEYEMGFNCCVGDAADMADRILQLMQDDDLRERMGKNARRCAEERFDREKTYQELVDAILNVAAG